MDKKKVVIVSNTAWSLFNFRLGLAKELKKNGYEVILVAPEDEYSDKLREEFVCYNIWMNNKGTNPLEDIKTTWQFYRLYKKIDADVLLHYTIKPNVYGTIAASFLGIKTINNIAGLGTLFIKQNFLTQIAKWLYKFSQAKATKIFFQNQDDYDLFVNANLVEKHKCSILPGSGVDTVKFSPVKYERKDNVFRFLLIARMLWDKGIKEYVEAARIIKKDYSNVEFLLLGFLGVANKTAISKRQMQEWTDEKIVQYLGTSDNVKKEIVKADCVVLPSYREGTPRSLLEAASMEKPLIATDVAGCRNVVDDKGNGFLCEVRNAQDLADKMEKMLKQTDKQRKQMGKKSREKILREFDEGIVIEKYLQALKEILV